MQLKKSSYITYYIESKTKVQTYSSPWFSFNIICWNAVIGRRLPV